MTVRHIRSLRWIAPLLALAALSQPARAQSVAPNAAPTGGRVVGGSAAISQTSSTTTINQGTNRAIINWQNFDVGSNQTVQFQQPSAQSMTLNRVITPNPSVIAGHIAANGGVALVNQSGVFFAQGAQVQAQSVIVSTADIGNRDFMAGGAMNFNRPGKADARIVNNGDITVKQAGLAALVAPQVVNHGLIQARLGTVVLAGAETHTIDLNGDGLVSFDVTGAVRQTPKDGQALVTNTGVVRANGGTVELTAVAADGIVQNLVRAGGRIQANTDAATGTTGHVLLQGTGGSISVAGDVSAQGKAAGTQGGTIDVVADRVQLEATARINASGKAAGGTVAIGTTLPGAVTPRLAQGTGIAKGAVIKADATAKGNGGHVVVNSSLQTTFAGAISVRGGPQGGDGGTVELSGQNGFSATGTIDATAPAGKLGSILIDPTNLTIVDDNDPYINVGNTDISSGILSASSPPADAYIGAGTVGGFAGDLTLAATNSIDVEAAVTKATGALTLQSGGTLTINQPITVSTNNLTLSGHAIAINSKVTANAVTVIPVTTFGNVTVFATISEGANGIINAQRLLQGGGTFGTISLTGENTIGNLVTLNGQSIDVHNQSDLLVSGTVTATEGLTIASDGNLTVSGTLTTTDSDMVLTAGTNLTVTASAVLTANLSDGNEASITLQTSTDPEDGFSTGSAGTMLLAGTIDGASGVTLLAGTGGIAQTGGGITGGTLSVQSGGDALLNGASTANAITGNIYASTSGDFVLDNGSTDITIPGTIDAANIGLSTTGTIFLTSGCGLSASNCVPHPAQLNAGDGDGRVSLRANGLQFNTGVNIYGDVVEIAPATSQPLVAGDAANTTINGSFMVNQDVLADIDATTLRLGATTFNGVTVTTASSVNLGGAITLSNGTLDLHSLGDISQDAAFSVDTLSGAAGGNVTLTLPDNVASTIGDLGAGNTLALTLNGDMSIAGNVSGNTVNLIATGNIAETNGGIVTAGLLTMATPSGTIAMGDDNVVTQLGASSTTGTLGFTDTSSSLTIPTGNTVQAGANLILENSGDLTINGTATGGTTTLRSSAGTLTVNGHSAIATNSVLVLSGQTVVTTGLISAATEIIVDATTATLGGTAQGTALAIQASSIAFNNLDAHAMEVELLLGTTSTAKGSLSASGLVVDGGSGVTLTGSISGITTGAAAALGVRATAQGVFLGHTPPNANSFTFNGCAIAVVACTPVVIVPPPTTTITNNRLQTLPPVGAASSPQTILVQNNPRQFDETLTNNWFTLPTPPAIGLFIQPSRDPGEDLELAPPNVRSEDF
jgi:filamentous hemagglutinin family protein